VSAASEASDGRALAGPGSSATVLADRIAAALVHHEPGWRLPRQTALARRYNVSPAEVDAAIGELSARHLIRRLPDGQLYRASPAEYLVSLEGAPGLAALVDPMGGQLDCRSRHVSWRRVPEDIGWSLGVPPGESACVVRLLWTAGGEPAALATAYLARHVAGPPAGPDSVPAAALSVLPLPGQALTPSAGPGDGQGGDGQASDGGQAGDPPVAWLPRSVFLEMQPPPPAVARSLKLTAGQPAAMLTVRFEEPGTGRPAALTVAVLRPDLFRIAVETPEGTGRSFTGAWTHALQDWDS
jgi:DNA-binding GntR family transcriptional regulator